MTRLRIRQRSLHIENGVEVAALSGSSNARSSPCEGIPYSPPKMRDYLVRSTQMHRCENLEVPTTSDTNRVAVSQPFEATRYSSSSIFSRIGNDAVSLHWCTANASWSFDEIGITEHPIVCNIMGYNRTVQVNNVKGCRSVNGKVSQPKPIWLGIAVNGKNRCRFPERHSCIDSW